jgi:ELWxxDGT repeat protein
MALDADHGYEPWKSDGTESGTSIIKDIVPGTGPDGSSLPREFADVDGTVYFSAYTPANGHELWKTDGTEDGTSLVKDISTSTRGLGSFPSELRNFGGTLYLNANDEAGGSELWTSDGSEAGTKMVKDIRPGGEGSIPWRFVDMGDTLYFFADDGTNGIELWNTDGTADGTTLVKDIAPGSASSYPGDEVTRVGDSFYFSANDGTSGSELWKSDGTAAGTKLVRDINDAGSSFPDNLTAVGGTLYFTAFDETNGFELWRSDGTEAGTALVQDLDPNSTGGPGPKNLTEVAGTLYFTAGNRLTGRELWALDPNSSGPDPLFTSIDSGPSGPTNDNSPTFTFSSEAGAMFKCRLDGPGAAAGTYAACPSPKTYVDLADGAYTFRVRATDTAFSFDHAPEARSFAVDTVVEGEASGRRTQRQTSRKILVKVRIDAREDVEVEASGEVTVHGKLYRLEAVDTSIGQGTSKTLCLRPSRRKATKKVFKALRGSKGRAKVRTALTDNLGNLSKSRLSVALKR